MRTLLLLLLWIDFLTVANSDEVEKGVECIRSKVPRDKCIKRFDKRLFEEDLGGYLKKDMLEEKVNSNVR